MEDKENREEYNEEEEIETQSNIPILADALDKMITNKNEKGQHAMDLSLKSVKVEESDFPVNTYLRKSYPVIDIFNALITYTSITDTPIFDTFPFNYSLEKDLRSSLRCPLRYKSMKELKLQGTCLDAGTKRRGIKGNKSVKVQGLKGLKKRNASMFEKNTSLHSSEAKVSPVNVTRSMKLKKSLPEVKEKTLKLCKNQGSSEYSLISKISKSEVLNVLMSSQSDLHCIEKEYSYFNSGDFADGLNCGLKIDQHGMNKNVLGKLNDQPSLSSPNLNFYANSDTYLHYENYNLERFCKGNPLRAVFDDASDENNSGAGCEMAITNEVSMVDININESNKVSLTKEVQEGLVEKLKIEQNRHFENNQKILKEIQNSIANEKQLVLNVDDELRQEECFELKKAHLQEACQRLELLCGRLHSSMSNSNCCKEYVDLSHQQFGHSIKELVNSCKFIEEKCISGWRIL